MPLLRLGPARIQREPADASFRPPRFASKKVDGGRSCSHRPPISSRESVFPKCWEEPKRGARPGFPDAGAWSALARGRHESFGWCDYERLPAPLAGLHLVVFACLMLSHWLSISNSSQTLGRSRAVYLHRSMPIPQMWRSLPRDFPLSAHDWGQVLMFEGKSCSHFGTYATLLMSDVVY